MTDKDDPNGQMIKLTSADGASIGAFYVAASGPRRGGLVLVMEIFGVTEHIRDLARGFAREGYDVLAPALYDRLDKGFEADYSSEGIVRAIALRDQTSLDTAIPDTQAAIDFLAGRGATPVFITGYCYGGSIAWIAACRCRGLAAASGYYGRLIIDHVEEQPRCPTILHFGRHDATIPMDGVEAIDAAHDDVPVYVYEAGHGFNSDRRRDYNPEAATLARRRTLEHFRRHEK